MKASRKTSSCPKTMEELRPWLVRTLRKQAKRVTILESRLDMLEADADLDAADADANGVDVESLVSELTRALLLTGDGGRFEPTVMEAIRHFRETNAELERIKNDVALSEAKREDVVAGFSLVLGRCKASLARLEVKIEPVEVGTAVDANHHKVVKRIPADNGERPNTVARCIQPGFSWRNGYGELRQKPADVAIFDERPRPEPEFANAEAPIPSSPPYGGLT